MKLDLKSIVIVGLIALIVWQNFFTQSEEVKPDPVTITIPERSGYITDTIEVIKKDTLYLPSKDKIVEVDAGWKERYNNAIDSLERQRLYYESIQIRDYEKILVDNDTLLIRGFATTRGSLLSYSVDYKVKPFDFDYTPEVVTKRPDLSVGFGIEAGLPTGDTQDFRMKGSIYFENSKGGGFSVGADTRQTLWIGLRKTFKLKN